MKTLALIDLIGIKARLADGTGAAKLKEFWTLADAWTNSQSIEGCRPAGERGTIVSPQAIVTAWSDSLLVQSEPELELKDFYEKILSPLRQVVARVDKSYAVVCRGSALDAPDGPALGGRLMRRDGGGNAWTQVFGSGPVWINLWLADKFVNRKTEWHDRFSLYAVGNDSVYQGLAVKETSEMRGTGGATVPIHAVEQSALQRA